LGEAAGRALECGVLSGASRCGPPFRRQVVFQVQDRPSRMAMRAPLGAGDLASAVFSPAPPGR